MQTSLTGLTGMTRQTGLTGMTGQTGLTGMIGTTSLNKLLRLVTGPYFSSSPEGAIKQTLPFILLYLLLNGIGTVRIFAHARE